MYWLDSSIARKIAFTVFWVFLGEFFGESQDFFRMILPYLLCGDGREADAIGDCPGSPGFADTKTVHLSDFHVRNHLRRRYGDQSNILIRIDAARGQPITGPHSID